jgi:hypothetical protein
MNGGIVMEFLAWLESGSIATWVRESLSLWAYPTIVAFHAVGLAFLVGTNVALNLRVLGVAPRVPMTALREAFPIMWAGFAINAFTGILLTTTAATKFMPNPIFLMKLGFIVLAITNLWMMKNRLFGNENQSGGKALRFSPETLAYASFAFWFGAIVMGRLTAYPLLLIDLFGS